MRHALRIGVTLAFLARTAFPSGEPVSTDPDVERGIAFVEDGDYDAAILTLDNAARRLAQDKARTKDLSQAYLYLGIAYLGKGHEAAARAKFREAIAQIKDLSLSPEMFPPKVIDAFEAAKAESTGTGPGPAPSTDVSSREPPAKTKKGGGKGLLILGGVAAAGGIAAVAAGGGGGAAPTTTTTQPRDPRTVQPFGPLTLSEAAYSQEFKIVVAGTGVFEATLTWTSTGGARAAVLAMDLYDAGFAKVATSNRTNDTTSVLTANVTPLTGAPSQEYKLEVFHRDSCDGCAATFNLTVRHP
jgi:tetratricopeptide (TPR) repeat protein